MTSDRELLRRYAEESSGEAFREIVHRHVNLVYGAALRQLCGNSSLAQDVTQAVFTALATKAAAASHIQHLSAWLYTTTRFTVSHTVRSERRRQNREQDAHSIHVLSAESEHEVPAVPPELLDTVRWAELAKLWRSIRMRSHLNARQPFAGDCRDAAKVARFVGGRNLT